MRPIAAPLIHSTEWLWRLIQFFTYLLTYLRYSVICASVCLSCPWALQKRLKRSDAIWRATDSCGPKKHVSDGGQNGHRKGQFWGLSGQLKSNGNLCSLLRCMQQKGNSIVNNGTTCDAAFHQNYLIIIIMFVYSIDDIKRNLQNNIRHAGRHSTV